MPGKADYYVGWDVGGWNCDKNQNSRDAIVVLDGEQRVCGTPWRGNLRSLINKAHTTAEWVNGLFHLCNIHLPQNPICATMAIDTPLGFSQDFVNLIGLRQSTSNPLRMSSQNHYLYRQTERFLFEHGFRPLSPVKDMIGSQATKGMHVLAKFAPTIARCGVWTDDDLLTALEAYPTVCNRSSTIADLRSTYGALGNADKEDALACALVAYLFVNQPHAIQAPSNNVATAEGWIWAPKDALF